MLICPFFPSSEEFFFLGQDYVLTGIKGLEKTSVVNNLKMYLSHPYNFKHIFGSSVVWVLVVVVWFFFPILYRL